jgi:hypothetical protein
LQNRANFLLWVLLFVAQEALRWVVDDDHAHGWAKALLGAVQVEVRNQRPRPHLFLFVPLHLIFVFVYDADDGRRRLCFPIEKHVLQRIQV